MYVHEHVHVCENFSQNGSLKIFVTFVCLGGTYNYYGHEVPSQNLHVHKCTCTCTCMPLQPYITPLSSSLNLEYKKLTHVVGRCRSALFCLRTHQMSPDPTHGHNEGHTLRIGLIVST